MPQSIIAIKNEILSGDGFIICGSLNEGCIKGVARRFADLFLKGPVIKPSIKGIIAAEIIKDVKRKSALRKRFKNAESKVRLPEIMIASIEANNRAIMGGRKESLTRASAAANPPA